MHVAAVSLPRRPRTTRLVISVVTVVSCLALPVLATPASTPASASEHPSSVRSGARVLHARALHEPPTYGETRWWIGAMRLRQVHRRVTGKGVQGALIDDSLDPRVPELVDQRVRLRVNCGGRRAKRTSGLPQSDHGTSMAALIVGSGQGDGPGGRGVPGVAPDAGLLFYGVDPVPRTHRWECTSAQMAAVVDRAVRDGADIISMSRGMLSSDEFGTAIRRALRADVVVVAAIGNRGDKFGYSYPAWYPGVVAVGGVNDRLRRWPGSPRDDSVTVVAPGARVNSGGVVRSRGWTSMYYAYGTSVATAITSGALALVKSRYPDASANQLIQHLVHTAAGGKKGFDWRLGYGFGFVNVPRMLASSPHQWPDENPLWLPTRRALDDYPMWMSSRIKDPPPGARRSDAPESDGGRKATSIWWDDVREPPEEAASGLPGFQHGHRSRWLWTVGATSLVAVAVLVVRRRRAHR